MTPEEEIFIQALEFQSDRERRAFLVGACGGDATLLGRIQELLAAHGKAGESGFFVTQALHSASPIFEGEGTVIDRYKLLQKIGEGGFGVVYMAEQREPVRRRVALKIIKLGMDTLHVVGRFEAERQALAMMDHPNIAKVLDAGSTASGRPYFVMELVRGVPMMQFADEQKLSTRARLELFLDVCGAVQHAHQKGIIHRDLKPSNVIVGLNGDRPVPKVIDFGIAKAMQHDLTDKTVFTRFEEFVGTPAYMSPEQTNMSGVDIDTRSDIYSLGILLYELLAGHAPFDGSELQKAGLEEMRRRIREVEPPRPSTRVNTMERVRASTVASARRTDPARLGRMLRGELDWIVMKAIEKDRGRRYATANAFALDVRRYLTGETVEACPPTTLYRLKKLARRHRTALSVAAGLVVALSVGASLAAWQALRATRAEAEATAQLWNAYLAKTRATVRSGHPGRRFDSVETLRKAAAIRPSLELRSEAIAALSLPDARLLRPLGFREPPDGASAIDDAGGQYALGYPTGEVTVHRLEDHRKLLSLPSHHSRVYHLDFSRGGKLLMVGCLTREGPKVFVWDLATPTQPRFVVTNVVPARFDQRPGSGELALPLNGNRVALHDLETGAVTSQFQVEFPPQGIQFRPDGNALAVYSMRDQHALVYAVPGGELIGQFRKSSGFYSLAWSPDGKWLAGGSADFSISIWDADSGAHVRRLLGHRGQVAQLEFHRSGRFLVSSAWDSTSKVWDHRNGQLLLEIRGGFLGFSRSGERLLFNPESSNAAIWEFSEGAPWYRTYHLEGSTPDVRVASVSFSPDSRWLAAAARAGLAVWDLATDSQLAHSTAVQQIRTVRFGPNGVSLWAGGFSGICRFGLETEIVHSQRKWVIEKQQSNVGGLSEIDRMALSPDGLTIAARKGDVFLIDTTSGEQTAVLRGQAGLEELEFSPNGKWLAASSWKGAGVRVWDLEHPDATVNLVKNEPTVSATFSPDSRWLVTGAPGEYVFWNTGDWERGPSLARPDADGSSVGRVAFQPQGRWIALTLDGLSIHLLDGETLKLLTELRPAAPAPIAEMQFSPDGTKLAMATVNRDINVWDIEGMRQELAALGLDWD